MDPNTTLEILRATVAQFRKIYDDSNQIAPRSKGGADDALIDLGDTMAEAFDALDQWVSRGGFIPESWVEKDKNQ